MGTMLRGRAARLVALAALLALAAAPLGALAQDQPASPAQPANPPAQPSTPPPVAPDVPPKPAEPGPNPVPAPAPSPAPAPAPGQPAPTPSEPAPNPAPQTPAPETPAPETPAPETPAPETPAPETPEPPRPPSQWLQGTLYDDPNIFIFVLVTLIMGGAAGYAAGKALAATWRPGLYLAGSVLVLTVAVRFIHFAMFGASFLSPHYYPIDALLIFLAAAAGFRLTRVRQMTTRYRWLYERSGTFGWRIRSDAAEPPAK